MLEAGRDAEPSELERVEVGGTAAHGTTASSATVSARACVMRLTPKRAFALKQVAASAAGDLPND